MRRRAPGGRDVQDPVLSRFAASSPPTRLLRLSAALLAAALLGLDHVTGPYVHFPITFVFPVSLASWHGRWQVGLLYAVAMPFAASWVRLRDAPWPAGITLLNAAVQVGVLGLIAWLVDRAARERRLRLEVRILEGLLPICSFCKRIRDPEGRWERMEKYISERSGAEFTHGLCPECREEHYGALLGKGRADADAPEAPPSGTRGAER